MGSVRAYRNFSKYYDRYAGSFRKDLELYAALSSKATNILEVGCGTGRVLPVLLGGGRKVVGVDTSCHMLRVAAAKFRKAIASGELILKSHDLRRGSLQRRFDLVVVTFFAFNYLIKTSEQRRVLRSIRDSLSTTGIVCFDLFCPYLLERRELDGKWIRESTLADSELVVWSRRHMKDLVEQRTLVFDSGERLDVVKTSRRFVSKAQMTQLLLAEGFSDVRISDEYDLESCRALHMSPQTTSAGFICLASRA